MPKYKDSPEVRAAKKERKEKLREFSQLLDVEDYSDLRSVFKEMVGEVLENMAFSGFSHLPLSSVKFRQVRFLPLDSKCRVPKRNLGFESLTLRHDYRSI